MNQNVVSEQIKRAYPDNREISKGILRVERAIGNTKYSVIFFDYATDVFSEEFDVEAYQNKFISAEYYKTQGTLQWNHYLIFVLPETSAKNQKTNKLRSEIENNRQFTRKYLINETELGAFLEPKSLVDMVSEVPPEASPYNRWVQQLNTVDLDGLHLGDDYTAIIDGLKTNRVIKERPNAGTVTRADQLNSRLHPLNPIDYLQINDFKRARPLPGTYPLGQFTLLFGPNGIGKTSFLEAVEMSYCGMSARNSKFRDPSLKFGLKYKNVDDVDFYDPESPQKYRDRDLHWYENRYEGRNRLCESFAKYNFFDTDSAARLSASTDAQKALVDAFISLSLGDKVNHLEDRMLKLQKSLKSELNKCDSAFEEQKKKLDDGLLLVGSMQSKTSGLGQEYALLEQTFLKTPSKFKLPLVNEIVDSDFSQKLEAILNSSAKARNSIYWEPIITPHFISTWKERIGNDLRIFSLYFERQKSLSKDILNLKNQTQYFSKLKQVIDRVTTYQKFVDVTEITNIGKRLSDLNQRKTSFGRAVDFLLQFNLDVVLKAKILTEALNEIQSLKDSTNIQLVAIAKKINEFKSQQEMVNGIIQAIRIKAKELIQITPDIEECPICLTHHPFGSLDKILKSLSGQGMDSASLATNIQEQSKLQETLIKLERAEAQLKKMSSLHSFLQQEGMSAESIEETRALKPMLEEKLQALSVQFDNLQAIEQILNANGLSEAEYAELLNELGKGAANLKITFNNISDLANILNRVKQEELKLDGENKRIEGSGAANTEIGEIRARIGQLKSDDEVLSELKRRQIEILNIQRELELLQSLVDLAEDQELRAIEQLFQSVHQQYIQFRATERTEREKGSVLPAKLREIDELKKNLDGLAEVKVRFSKALETLNSIIQLDSKAQNLERFLGTYKHFILKIFTRIHRPVEFLDINIKDQEILLTRTRDNASVPLTMISTGQRAALALAIFLSLNLSLRKGPPVILIDDPVAHVDDLNTLAFLDYLREIVATNRRQIIFATADSKMAQLIRRKFDFLGNEFAIYPTKGDWQISNEIELSL